MTGQKNGGFIVGANAIVQIDGKILALSRDVQYNISIPHIPIEALGSLEVLANEPVSYSVSGSFSVYRYTKCIAGELTVDAAMADGNSISAYGKLEHVNPAQILFTEAFEIVVQVKDNTSATTKGMVNVLKFIDCRITNRSSGLDKRNVMVDRYDFVAVLGGDFSDTLNKSAYFNDGVNVAATT